MITIRKLKKEYPNITPLRDVNAEINKGDMISVIGPSGTGKSTLLRCINRLETPTSGAILVDGVDICGKNADLPKLRRKMGMVFQNFNLFGHMSIIENIMRAPVDLLGKTNDQAYERGMELLQTVGLAAKAESYPDELSGGQKQRAAIARALAMEPEILLFDEPTSALDPTMVGEVLSVIKRLADDGLTMLIVTHEMNFAKNISNRVFYMDEGIIYEDGTPWQIFENPQKEKTRRFIKQIKVFSEIIDKSSFDFPAINSSLELFGRKQMMSQKQIYKMQLVFEELVMQKLIPEKGVAEIRMDIEYFEKESSVDMIFGYSGENFDPLADPEDLSAITLKGITSTVTHKYDKNKNVLVLKIRR
ncbi:MAG: amino acid ABC transporter ATP-binding protein [Bacteroides sp.]|nr:amino acid ABC transporter ATP-binding protein [Ruminococcus sp.]MCM1463715.1 amino acid ABC transporter ATP-binding protein [Bacteroides sp.]